MVNWTGGSGDDVLAGDENANILTGQGGHDLLYGRAEMTASTEEMAPTR